MDAYKFIRKVCSIFGNYNFETIRKIFIKSNEMLKASQTLTGKIDKQLESKIVEMFKNILVSSVTSLTGGNVHLAIKHCNENSFSPGDLGRFIDRLKVEGLKVKMIFADYLDVMVPTTMNGNRSFDEYMAQGQITQELRQLSRIHSLPLITASQNIKASENMMSELSNQLIGDSYKKIRYADYVYMCRFRRDKTFLSEDVRKQVIPYDLMSGDAPTLDVLKIKDKLCEDLIPFEMKITKAKESGKDFTKFFLFCKHNLRIYNNIKEYMDDSKKIEMATLRLEKDLGALSDLAIASVSGDFLSDTESYEPIDISNFENEPILEDTFVE